MPQEKDRVMAIRNMCKKNLVMFGRVFSSYASGQTNRHTHHKTAHLSRGRGQGNKYGTNKTGKHNKLTRGSAMAEGPRDALVSRNSATTKHPIYRVALFA